MTAEKVSSVDDERREVTVVVQENEVQSHPGFPLLYFSGVPGRTWGLQSPSADANST